MLGYLENKTQVNQETNDGNMSPTLKTQIEGELDDRNSISSAVFDNMMTNQNIRQDVLRELNAGIQTT